MQRSECKCLAIIKLLENIDVLILVIFGNLNHRLTSDKLYFFEKIIFIDRLVT